MTAEEQRGLALLGYPRPVRRVWVREQDWHELRAGLERAGRELAPAERLAVAALCGAAVSIAPDPAADPRFDPAADVILGPLEEPPQ